MTATRIKLGRKPVPAALTVMAMLLAGAVFCYSLFFSTPGDGRNMQFFDVGQGGAIKKIAAELESKRIIGSARLFLLYARLHGYDSRIKAGTYQFNDGVPVTEILRKLVAGEIYEQRFAVPEGYSTFQIGELLEGRRFFSKESFLRRCSDRKLLRELHIDAPNVEGFLYPSTYNVTPKMSEADLIRQMVEQFQKVYAQRFAERVKATGMRARDVLILASMVEKEAVVASERPLIASVFLNRLRKRMRLQSDPTAVYGVRAFAGKVSKGDILRSSAYNTYFIPALPPGPVGNPGSSAIEAVINPASTSYLYFVARKDGTHQFSVTLDEHNKAVRHYLRDSAINNHLLPSPLNSHPTT